VRLLLDTHVFLWWLRDDRRLGRATRQAIGAPVADVRVSAASIWEISFKASIGRLDWRDDDTTLARCIADAGFVELPVDGGPRGGGSGIFPVTTPIRSIDCSWRRRRPRVFG
jgi:PIN domain nuclease of toxin-antitoxin system